MRQNVTWPVALVAVGALLLVLAAVFYRSGGAGSQARVSPGFQQMSPQERQEALFAAENARRRRGGQPPVARP